MASTIAVKLGFFIKGRTAGGGARGHNGGVTEPANSARVDTAVREYIERIDARHRPLFDRIHELILAAYPEATVVISYQMPTYRVLRRRLYLGVWQHGISLYGWPQGQDGGFTARHPELRSGKGTIRIRADDAGGITDDELDSLVRAALGPG
jgi:uncharacterized protein YdhG (YjbR/CyaY superfamily)